MRKLFRTKMLPFLLTLSLITNGIAPGLVQPSTVYAAEAPSGTTTAVESTAAQTETADVVLKNGGIEIGGQFYTDAEFKTLLENSKIVKIPFDSETGRSMIEQAVVSGLVIDTAALAVLGVAIASVFIMLAVRLSLASLKDNAYQVITGNGKVYDFRFLGDALFINNTYINAFTSTIAVITSFFDNHLTANPDEEIVDPDAGTGDVDKPGEGTEGDSESEDNSVQPGDPNENPDPVIIADMVVKIIEIIGNLDGKCDQFALQFTQRLEQLGISFKIIRVESTSGIIYSDRFGMIGTNGYHYGVQIGNLVFDNKSLTGMIDH